jgi:cyclic-di-AMP phosphodiesterase PgpH
MLRTRVRAGALAGVIVSLVFALLVALVQSVETFVPQWAPQMGQPLPVTLRLPYSSRITIAQHLDQDTVRYDHVRVIIPRQTVLDENNGNHRAAFAYESMRRPRRVSQFLSYLLIFFTLGVVLATYLRRFGQNRLRLIRTQVGLFILMFVTLAAAKALLLFTGAPEFWVPVAAAPLWIALSYDRRTAILVAIVMAFFGAALQRFDIMLLIIFMAQGVGASILFFGTKRPRQMILSGALSGVSAAILYIAVAIVFEGAVPILAEVSQGSASTLIACVGGGTLSGILAHVLREPVQRLLGQVSRDHLHEMTDLEQPLLQKMAREAPGSWEHSRAMANLAEAAASAIGADALLTRVGAYYHDLGKTTQPKYFVENLTHGEVSPHTELEPDVSADAIMAHVVVGTKILREGGIPEPVVEFAYTHHGTQVVEYFWHKCQEQGNAKGLSRSHFRYPGMKPQTKETAILMLVDSIEAASRTVDPPERSKFEEMIQRVIFTKLRSGQLDDSGLITEDYRILVERMADTLVNMYHSRIKYPWQKQQEEKAKELAAAQLAEKTAEQLPEKPRFSTDPKIEISDEESKDT